MRQRLASLSPVDAMNELLTIMKSAKSNQELIDRVAKQLA
jgi:transcription termination factor Rho